MNQRIRSRHSRRTFLQSVGVGIGAVRSLGSVSAQPASSSSVDALYDSAAAMPHLFGDVAFPFIRRNWALSGRGTLFYALETAVAAQAVTPEDSVLLGSPTALYLASLVDPQGESWSTARLLTIAAYPSAVDAAAAVGRFVAAGPPAGATDLTGLLDPGAGPAMLSASTVDLSGTPAEQIVGTVTTGNWLFRYTALAPQQAATNPFPRKRSAKTAALPFDPAGRSTYERGLGEYQPGVNPMRLVAARAQTQIPSDDVVGEIASLLAAANAYASPETIRALLHEKGYDDETIDGMGYLLFPMRFTSSVANRIDYVKHNQRYYSQYRLLDAENELQRAYYAEPMCVFADDGPIPPSNSAYLYRVTRFFPTSAAAADHLATMPTPAQQESHTVNGLSFQDDPEASTQARKASYILWQPSDAPAPLPGYGVAQQVGPIVQTNNVYLVQPPPGSPAAIDPAAPAYQALRSGLLNILEQQQRFASGLSGWPVYDTPADLAG